MVFNSSGRAGSDNRLSDDMPSCTYDVDNQGRRRTTDYRPSRFTTEALALYKASGSRQHIGYQVVDGVTHSNPRFMSIRDSLIFKHLLESGQTVIVDYVYSKLSSEDAMKRSLLGLDVEALPDVNMGGLLS